MKEQNIKILTLLLTSIFIISCGHPVVSNQKEQNQWQGVDWVTVYQDDQSDTIPKNKIIYKTAWGNTPDSLKPRFDINFCNDHFRFPFYFPDRDQLTGQAGQTNTKIENKHLQAALRSAYTMTYNKGGMITKYDISGPATIYSSSFMYDSKNRIEQITDGWKKINITYNDFDNIETITELNPSGQTNKILRFTYTYVTFPRN